MECRHIRRREQVAVVHQPPRIYRQRPVKGVPMHRALIELLLDPGVYDQLVDGVVAVQRQQRFPLLRIVLSDAGLDGHPHIRQTVKYLVQTPLSSSE